MSPSNDKIPPASIIGRIGKLLVGSFQIWGVVSIAPHFLDLRDGDWRTGLWIFVALAFYLVSFNVRLGFHRVLAVGNAPAGVALLLSAGLAGVQWLQTEAFWGSTVATYALGLAIAVHAHMGVCHVLAAVIGIPGCEMRVIPYLISRLRGKGEESFHLCPGMWTPIDRWEARLRGLETAG